MALVVTYQGRRQLAGGNGDYLWSYTVRSTQSGDLPSGTRVALGLPGDTPVQDPQRYSGVPELQGVFVQEDVASSRRYVGRVVSAPGPQLIAFVAPDGEARREVLLVTRESGQPWTAVAYAAEVAGSGSAPGSGPAPGLVIDVGAGPAAGDTDANAVVDVVQLIPTPEPRHPAGGVLAAGRPEKDFAGVLPYAAETFGLYQPLIGWRSALHQQRLDDAAASRFTRAAALVGDSVSLTGPGPAGVIGSGRPTDRTGTNVGRLLAGHAAQNPSPPPGGSGGAYTSHDWPATLSGAPDSPLNSILRAVTATHVPHPSGGPDSADPKVTSRFYTVGSSPAAAVAPGVRQAADQATREAAAATLLHYLGRVSPDTVSQMFTATIDPWRRALAAADWFSGASPTRTAFLSPIGILHMFREYFFELGTFLGPPLGHVWISPGGTVELIEVNTRRQLIERTVEQSTETTDKSELATTDQDELSDAVKVENATDTRLGITAGGSGGVAGVWQASASGTLNVDLSRRQAQEQTHKKMREQSAKLSSEVRRNYKTTFRTVTETTDTSSRRYVLANTTNDLASYELSRKMRKVAVQVQDLGRQLCWQLYVDNPGDTLGLGEFVHATSAALDPGVKPPEYKPEAGNQQKTYPLNIPFKLYQGADHDAENTYKTSSDNADHGIFKPDVGKDDIIQFKFAFTCPPPPAGYVLGGIASIDFHGADVTFTTDPGQVGMAKNPDPNTNGFGIKLTYANFGGRMNLPFDVTMDYVPTAETQKAVHDANAALKKEYDDEVALKKEQLFYDTLRTRLKLVGKVAPRPGGDLREEERSIVYRHVITRLYGNETGWTNDDYHVASELIRYLFDVDSMLYFVAPDWWRPRHQQLASKDDQGELQPTIIADPPLSERMKRLGKYRPLSSPDGRPYYLITEETVPAPEGASLGWLIQLDGDAHRNAFLNSPWVKAVLPIRPGRERDALAWLQRPEVVGTDGLNEPYPYDPDQDPPEYQGLSIEEVLLKIADKIALEYRASLTPVAGKDPTAVNQQLALPTETVFSHGFDPLEGGIKFGADAFQVFSQWTEILPTDQVVATKYDLTGL